MAKNSAKKTNKYIKGESRASFFRRYAGSILQVVTGVAAIVGMSLVFVFAHDWITQCDYFRAEQIIIKGTDRLEPGDIRNAAGLREGINILSVNLSTVRKRLLSEPWIDEVDIQRDFPGTMNLEIREHEPFALIDLGRMFLINTEGVIFKETRAEAFPDLPVISGVDYPDWKEEGKQGSTIFDAVMDVLNIGKSRDWRLFNDRIEEILVDRELGLTLVAGEPVFEIVLGYGDYETKFRHFDKIFDYLGRNDRMMEFELMDIRNPDRIVARPVKENGATAKKEV